MNYFSAEVGFHGFCLQKKSQLIKQYHGALHFLLRRKSCVWGFGAEGGVCAAPTAIWDRQPNHQPRP